MQFFSFEVLISSMKEVLIGKKTDVFRGRDASECLEECCFSIVYGDQGETLDLMAKDADETNAWVTGLMSLMGAADLIETMFHGHPDERNGWLTSCFRRKIAMSTITKEHHLSDEQVVELISELCPTFSSQKIRHRLKESLWKSSGGESPRAITQVDEELFLELYKEVTTRPEIYHLLIRHSNKEYMTTEDLVSFLEVEQGMVDVSHKYAATVIEEFEPGEPARTNNHLHIEGLTRFLISDTCDIFDMEQRTVCQDMNQPLSHYFIASSHNTYLVEDQLKGPSSVEGYVQALANGARFVEIDLWDGDNNDPVVYHGHTLTSKLPFRRVMEAVKAYAFERSPYPLILSIEMHCSMQQQAVVVELLHECLGPFLWQAPSDGEPGQDLPSPETLRNKILILGRKLPPSKSRTVEDSGEITEEDESAESLKFRNHQRTGSIKKIRLSKGFSDLVSCQYYRFQSFQKSRSQVNEPSVENIPETMALKLAHSAIDDFVRFTERNLVRVYPSGMRIDSSNFSPQEVWCCGCQIAALNYQSVGMMMDLNNARFAQNGNCGYVLKPLALLDPTVMLNASRNRIPTSKPKTLCIKVISAVNLPKPNGAATKGDVIDPFVKIDIFGVSTDCAGSRTKTVANNNDPVFDETIEFHLTAMELAILRFLVLDDDCIGDDFIGQYSISVPCVQTGYRHIRLKSLYGRDIPNCYLFVHVAITDKRGGGVLYPQPCYLGCFMAM
ncbi:hypothetical protein RvY_09143-1 [Ramazzottius varieornatus]|uniref:Phosphoinositide phospholipase C n=1 Tax=Ramazzottius varieornatus TaxID=947166 RepID=A0A1D1V8F7_RAMVA|nr:hypothetical protein RvY_09143-1 [Ramazzottius varieornatus]